jgi:hypothetical protein
MPHPHPQNLGWGGIRDQEERREQGGLFFVISGTIVFGKADREKRR